MKPESHAVDERAVEAAWNAISDEHNKWSCLSLDERDTYVAFVAAYEAAALAKPEAVGEVNFGPSDYGAAVKARRNAAGAVRHGDGFGTRLTLKRPTPEASDA